MAFKLKKNYQDVVIGAGLAGLCLGQYLKKQGREVLLLEQYAHPGGRLAPAIQSGQLSQHRLRVVPDTEATRESLQILNDFLLDPIEYTSVEEEIATFSGLKPDQFVGFGSNPPDFYQVLTPYLSCKVLQFSGSFVDWIGDLVDGLDIATQQTATRLSVEQGRITSIQINGSKELTGERVFFTADPRALASLVEPITALAPRQRQRLEKALGWSAIGLDIVLAKDSLAPQRVLLPGTKNDNSPAIGRFSVQGDQLIGQFLTFVEGRAEVDGEVSGAAVRRLRRQIRKYYPNISDSIIAERVTVSPQSHGSIDLNRPKGRGTLTGFENLWLAHRSLAPESVFPCEMLSVKEVLNSDSLKQQPDNSDQASL